jgi:hypothetical protein
VSCAAIRTLVIAFQKGHRRILRAANMVAIGRYWQCYFKHFNAMAILMIKLPRLTAGLFLLFVGELFYTDSPRE